MQLDHFSLIAGIYNRAVKFKASREFLEFLDLSPNMSLLDVGGGTGRVAATINSLVGHVVVADPSLSMLRYAAGKGLSTICGTAEEMPFPPDSFDRIIIMDAFHHVRDQRATARALWRSLARGGRILIIEPDIHQFRVKLIAVMEKLLLMRSHFLDEQAIVSLFEVISKQSRVVHDGVNLWICIEKEW